MKKQTLIIIAITFFFNSCGRDTVHTKYVPIEAPPNTGTSPGGNGSGDTPPSYQETVALLNNYCLKCHANAAFLASERGLLASAVKQRVWSKSMPPNQGDLGDSERKKILAFFL